MTFRCPGCRTRRVSWPALKKHQAKSGCELCDCTGYHFKHRPGSKYCHKNALSELWECVRRGESREVLFQVADDLADRGVLVDKILRCLE